MRPAGAERMLVQRLSLASAGLLHVEPTDGVRTLAFELHAER